MNSLIRLLRSNRRRISFFIVAAALGVSACQPPDSRFLTAGIGAQLNAPNTAQTEKTQWDYFNFLCRQSGAASGVGGERCVSGINGSAQWTQLTYQGMNDIDRRCDGYLEWLDNKKRSRAPVLAQLGSVRNAATQIIEVTSSTVSALKAITIVSQAFDLITQSIENYHSRLLLEIDQRTINTIVLQARHKFREDFRGKSVSNKPQSEYVLRSYLRICLPFAIESVINGNATLVALGVRPDEADDVTIHQAPVLDSKPDVVFVETPRAPVVNSAPGAGGGSRKTISGSANDTEAGLALAIGKRIQRMVCAAPADGIFGDDTRTAIKEFEDGLHFPEGDAKADRFITDSERGKYTLASRRLNQCSKTHASAFEAGYFADATKAGERLTKIHCFINIENRGSEQTRARAAALGDDWFKSLALDATKRKAFAILNEVLSIPEGTSITRQAASELRRPCRLQI